MESLYQIVGCVVSSKPAADRIDDFAAQVRRERGVVVSKDALTATFVRFSAPDARLVALACQAVLAQVPAALRFGFAYGVKESAAAGQDGLSVSHRGIAQASDLAAGARDGEVLVSPEFAVVLIEAGYALRPKKVRLPGGRVIQACSLDLSDAGADAPSADSKSGAALGGVFRTLMGQAGELARKQAELEARLDARLARMEARLQALEGLEARIADLHGAASELERKVQAVKAEAEAVREISSRSTSDLEFVAAHRGELSELRLRLDQLLGHAEQADGKIALIESHRQTVEGLQARADAITHMLGDISVNLEMMGEQRAVIDHVGEKLARLDFTVQEAQNTLRALQHEREVAERVEQGLKALRHRSITTKLL